MWCAKPLINVGRGSAPANPGFTIFTGAAKEFPSLAPRRNFLLGYRRHGQGSYRCRDLERVSDSVWLGRTAGGLAVPCGSCDFRLVRADLLVPLGRDASGPVALRQ